MSLPMLLVMLATCGGERESSVGATPRAEQSAPANEVRSAEDGEDPTYERSDERRAMVRVQLAGRDVHDEAVLAAMGRVPRHLFVPDAARGQAYGDHPVRIGHEQTISQPYIVGLMSQLLEVRAGDHILEIGTGSGYQAAVLDELGAEVFSIEIVAPLGERATAVLDELGYEDVHVRIGDGYLGWPEHAPFDSIILTASPPEIPQPLLDQLAVGGRLVAPVGQASQELVVITRTQDGFVRRPVIPVRFVPMTGRAQQDP